MNNRSSPDLPPLALIAGPTASGKSALALQLAERCGGVIVNADATQVYRDLRILSARPGPEDEARAEHRLYGHVDGAIACDAASWALAAKAVIADAHAKGQLPIVVGGTGLYIRTLLDGIAPIPPIDPEVRAMVRAMPVGEAHRALRAEDPAAAERLAPTDASRIARALEVIRSTGRGILRWRAAREGGVGSSVRLSARVLLPPRDGLHARCATRFSAMLAAGAAEEVKTLLDRRLDPDLPVMRAIGVREIAAWLTGTIGEAAMRDAAAAATRQYVKRQTTWLRHQAPPTWQALHDADIDDIVIKLLDELLTR